ncbi:hypothetical protein Mal15_26000 [Stieleria maiorica]|uniref:Uncharacterized protein n=1 Tax=Stieleria maiorica TaxID=2795974 RepID=A0A5B9MC07_9BACT|nr:hypothetical protein [Stieleria maiorica]QEF98548.1 hypothetical protein Mal15_26000 [Stieleria maiorica]
MITGLVRLQSVSQTTFNHHNIMPRNLILSSLLLFLACVFGCSKDTPTVSTDSNEIEAFLAENPELNISMEELDAQPEPGGSME